MRCKTPNSCRLHAHSVALHQLPWKLWFVKFTLTTFCPDRTQVTGELLDADVGSVMMFAVPHTYGERAMDESFLQVTPLAPDSLHPPPAACHQLGSS